MNIPFTNGKKILNISVNLKKGYESKGQEVVKQFERAITLAIIDENWKEHLREMDDLRTNVQNASVEQKDPLLIYKRESYDVFLIMMDKINSKVASFLMKAGILQQDSNHEGQQSPHNSFFLHDIERVRGSIPDRLGQVLRWAHRQLIILVVRVTPLQLEPSAACHQTVDEGNSRKVIQG